MTVKFKNPKTGEIIEVEETFAEQVIRRQKYYEELKDEEPKSSRTREVRVQGKPGKSAKK